MQQVSQAWIDAQRQTLVPESYVEVSMTVGDPDAQYDAQAESNGAQAISDVESVTKKRLVSPVLFATTELNNWGLDGNAQVLPDKGPYGSQGYIGAALSGADGSFSGPYPTITINFSKAFTQVIPGVSIVWSSTYGEWASAFSVRVYRGATLIANIVVDDNKDIQSALEFNVSNYDKVVVEIRAWSLPQHWARVEQISLGIVRTYGKSDLMSYQHTLTVDPLSAELPTLEISFELSNVNGQYNPDNPKGVEKYLMERQEITARYGFKLGDDVEWINGGTFYMAEWNCPQNGITASFKARDIQEFMTDLYTGPASGTLLDIANAAWEQANIPLNLPDGSSAFIVDQVLSIIQAPPGVDLSSYTIKEVLQLCTNAAQCIMYQDRLGVLHIKAVQFGGEADESYPIDQFNSYANSEITLSKQLRAVDINNGQYVLEVAAVGDTQQVTNPLISDSSAQGVAQWVASLLTSRRTLNGEFRADPRLDPMDRIVNTNNFAQTDVLVRSVTYNYNGAFRGTYEGRSGV